MYIYLYTYTHMNTCTQVYIHIDIITPGMGICDSSCPNCSHYRPGFNNIKSVHGLISYRNKNVPIRMSISY